jgi:hypothetical protein
MLAFARPSLKAGEKTDKQFSHYENYYKCSRCGYEIRGGKEGEHEHDQDAGDNGDDDVEEGDDGDEVDSWQRRRDLK